MTADPWAAPVPGTRQLQLADDEPPADLHERLVRDELRKLRARHDARLRFAAEQAPRAEPFDAGTLAQVLARPAEPAARVEGLLPWEASTLITAQRKTGKTTLLLNLARAVLTGEDFLGRFSVRPLDGTVALLNYEVSGSQVARWAHEAGVPADRLVLVNTRGRRNPLRDPADRQRLAAYLREHNTEMLLCDPFGRAYTGTSQNDAGEVGAWLVGLDQLAREEVGARDLVLTAHAGWNGERTRGSSALEDWADAVLTLTTDDSEDANAARYLRAIGRDVDLPEDRLSYDRASRSLTLTGAGSRRTANTDRRVHDLTVSVRSVLLRTPGLNSRGIGAALKEAGITYRKGEELQAVRTLIAQGSVRTEPGARGAVLHYAADNQPPLSPPSPTVPRGRPLTVPTVPIGGTVSRGQSDSPPSPNQQDQP